MKNTKIFEKLTIRPIQKTHPPKISNNQSRAEDLAPKQKQNRVDPIQEPKCPTSTFLVRFGKPKCGSQKALQRGSTMAVGQVCGRNSRSQTSRLVRVAWDLQHGYRSLQGLRLSRVQAPQLKSHTQLPTRS
jgi:hypothetical protein